VRTNFPTLFLNLYKICQIRYSYLLRHGKFFKGPRTLRMFPQKCQKIASQVLRVRHPFMVSDLWSPRNIFSRQKRMWNSTTYFAPIFPYHPPLHVSSSSDYKAQLSWYGGKLCKTIVDSWHCRDRVVSEGMMRQVSRQLEVGNQK